MLAYIPYQNVVHLVLFSGRIDDDSKLQIKTQQQCMQDGGLIRGISFIAHQRYN